MNNSPSLFALIKRTVEKWLDDNVPRLGAALAFYSALSIAPLLIFFIELGEHFWAKNVLTGHLSDQMNSLMGSDGTEIISTIVMHSQEQQDGLLAAILSLIVLAVGASGVFSELQSAMNAIWRVSHKNESSVMQFFKERFFSFAMILGTGFLLLVSLIMTMVLNFVMHYVSGLFSSIPYFSLALGWAISIGINTFLFASIFKLVPDADIRYKDVWGGALITAILFDIGKVVISMYLSHSAVRTTYGAAGSFIVFLMWVYYSAQILYFGAEFTHVKKHFSQLKPS